MTEKYERIMSGVLKEVENILKENHRVQGIHLEIDINVSEVPVISFEVKNRFTQM